MDRLRWTLLALLVTSTAMFAAGVVAERSESDTHAEPVPVQTEETGDAEREPESAHDEAAESKAAEGHAEAAAGESDSEDEQVLGVDLESTPLVALAVLAGLGLAALTATRFGRMRSFLLFVIAIALVWAALDLREVVHHVDESRTGIALVAMIVFVVHLAAAVGVRLAQKAGATTR